MIPISHTIIDWLSFMTPEKIPVTHGTLFSVPSKDGEDTQFLVQLGQKKGLFSSFNNATAAAAQQDPTLEQFTVITKSQIKGLQLEIGEEVLKQQVNEEPTKGRNTKYVFKWQYQHYILTYYTIQSGTCA